MSLTTQLPDHLPPASMEAEQATLGAALISRSAVERVLEMLERDDFYLEAHRRIYDAIAHLSERDQPVDSLSLSEELRRRGQLDTVGGMAYVNALWESVPTAAHVEFYARTVQEKSTLRKLIEASSQIIASAHEQEEEVDDIVDGAERLIFGVAQRRVNQGFVPIRPVLLDAMERLENVRANDSRLTGVPTGFAPLDLMTSGLQGGDLVIVAGRPSMGKTSLALAFAVNTAAMAQQPVAIFSLEMSKEQLAHRMICSEAKVDGMRLRTGFLRTHTDDDESDWTRLGRAIGRLGDLPIWLDDASDISCLEMRAKCRRLKSEHGIGLVVVDYLQLIRGHGRQENRNQEISIIARSLKGMARELDVPVVALSQLSRNVERREDKRPMLSDLRECVTGDTRLVNADTGRLVRIDEVRPGDQVLGLDARQKLGAFPVADVWSTGTKPVFRITTRTGRSVVATTNHPFLTAHGWRQVGELRAGDIIATAMRLPECGEEKPERAELCRLLGYMIGDGTFQKHREIGFCGSDPAVVEDAVAVVARHFPQVRWREKKSYGDYREGGFSATYENGYGRPYGNPFREWLRSLDLIGQQDRTKAVPDWVFEAGAVGAREFLAGYLATDGCVKRVRGRGWFVHFDTVSRRLAEDVQMLLLRLGVVAGVNDGYCSAKATRPVYRISVIGMANNLRRFVEQVHPAGRKGTLLDQMRDDLTEHVTNGSLFGLPPEVSDLLYEKSLHLRQQGRKLADGRRRYWKPQGKRPRRDICALFAARLKDEVLHVWAQSDLLWEEIRRIEPAGEQEVFDLRIPRCGNFLANGIVAHNSGSIEAEADIVMMLYRSRYYNRDGEDGASEPPPGQEWLEESELIIAKHRNGPVGTVRLGFLRRYARFEDLAEGYEPLES